MRTLENNELLAVNGAGIVDSAAKVIGTVGLVLSIPTIVVGALLGVPTLGAGFVVMAGAIVTTAISGAILASTKK